MAAVMEKLFAAPPAEVASRRVEQVCDYRAGKATDTATGKVQPIDLPSATVCELKLAGGAAVIVRPSGTEPKMKLYLTAKENTPEGSEQVLDALAADMKSLLGLG